MYEEIIAGAVKGAKARWKINPGDYQSPEDHNLWYCGKCNTRKETLQTILGKQLLIPCMCECEAQAQREAEKERLNKENRERISELNRKCFEYDVLKDYTFEAGLDEVADILASCKRYCDNFPQYRETGTGIILCGKVGRGKTYIAAAICNELIKHNVPCRMTSFNKIADDLMATFDKKSIYDELDNYQMLVLDDYGVERRSEYMDEIVETVINNRVLTGLPMIVTTNKTLEMLKHPRDIATERSFSRILSRCKVIELKGENLRNGIS